MSQLGLTMLNPKKYKYLFYSYDVLRQIHLNRDMFYKSLIIIITHYYFITTIMTNFS